MSLLLPTPSPDGRTYDACALRGQVALGVARLDQDLLVGGGQACTGIVKLAQWFVSQFCTVAGSVAFDPTAGTAFFGRLAAGRLRTEADLFQAFSFAVGDVKARARTVETAATPADERFADAVLERATLAAGTATLHVMLTSAAGTARPIVLPIPTSAP